MEVTVEHLGSVQFEIRTRNHSIISDQPINDGGFDEGMTPPELLLASDPLANLEGSSSAVRFDMDIFGLSLVEHNPGIEATGYGLLADFLRAVHP